MSFNILLGDFVQILNTGHQHWCTVSSIGMQQPQIRVFDSLCDVLPRMAQAQVASIMCTQLCTIKVQVVDVQKLVVILF